MPDRIPFDEETMTLIMGLGDPAKPGQHGRSMVPAPENKAIDVITQIRDLCEGFLMSTDKQDGDSSDEQENKDKPEGEAGDAPMPPEDEEEK